MRVELKLSKNYMYAGTYYSCIFKKKGLLAERALKKGSWLKPLTKIKLADEVRIFTASFLIVN